MSDFEIIRRALSESGLHRDCTCVQALARIEAEMTRLKGQARKAKEALGGSGRRSGGCG